MPKAKKPDIASHYKRGFWETLTKSRTLRVYNANKTVASDKNASMLNRAKIKQGILSATALYLRNIDNKLIFEIKDPSMIPTVLEVLDDLKDRFEIQHGMEGVPTEMRDRVIVLSLKEVNIFGV